MHRATDPHRQRSRYPSSPAAPALAKDGGGFPLSPTRGSVPPLVLATVFLFHRRRLCGRLPCALESPCMISSERQYFRHLTASKRRISSITFAAVGRSTRCKIGEAGILISGVATLAILRAISLPRNSWSRATISAPNPPVRLASCSTITLPEAPLTAACSPSLSRGQSQRRSSTPTSTPPSASCLAASKAISSVVPQVTITASRPGLCNRDLPIGSITSVNSTSPVV